MKKIIILILCICTILLSSCNKSKGASEQTNNGNDIHGEMLYYATWNDRIVRFDIMNKRASVACPDPLCDHKDIDCPVMAIDKLSVQGNYLYFVKGNTNIDFKVYCYDLLNGIIYEITECVDSTVPIMINEKSYFCAAYYEYDDDGNVIRELWDMYRYNPITKELNKLSTDPWPGMIYLDSYDESRITWNCDTGGDPLYFSTDYDFMNILYIDYSDMDFSLDAGDYSIEGQIVWDAGTWSETLFKVDKTTGERSMIIDGVATSRYCEIGDTFGYLYNTYFHSNDGNTLYFLDCSTFSIRKIATVPDGYSIVDVFVEYGNEMQCGDYVGIRVTNIESDVYSNSMWIINLRTGENFVISFEE